MSTALGIVEEELAERQRETQQQNAARAERVQLLFQQDQQQSNIRLAIYTSAASSFIALLCLLVTLLHGRRQSAKMEGWLSHIEGHLRTIAARRKPIRFARLGAVPIHKSWRFRRG